MQLTDNPSEIAGVLEDPQFQGAFQSSDIRTLAKSHPDFLGALAMPDVHTAAYPPVFLTIWSMLTGYAHNIRGLFKYFALGLPRGFGKTSLVKLLALYIILFTECKFILVVGETDQKARNIIADIFDMLDEPNIVAAFGDWRLGVEKDTESQKKFGFRGRTIVVAGLGVGGSVRGLNIKNARPDVMILDDIQSREASDSDVESLKIKRWFQSTLLKAKANYGALVLFIANMYPNDNSLLKQLKYNPEWEKVISGGILVGDEGKLVSLWEQVRSLESLMQEYRLDLAAGEEEQFFAEVLNDETASINKMVDVTKIPRLPYDTPELELHQGSFIVIDPATGKKNGDAIAIGYYQILDAIPVLWDLKADRYSPKNTIMETLKLCSLYGCRIIFVESVAYQATLGYWLNFFIERLGIQGIEVIEIYPGRRSKNSRILTMFKQLVAVDSMPEVMLHDRVRDRVLAQIRSFDPLRTDNVDDILDVLCYATPILTEYQEFIRSYTPLEAQRMEALLEGASDYTDQDNSSF